MKRKVYHPLTHYYRFLFGIPWAYRVSLLALPLIFAGILTNNHKRLFFFCWALVVTGLALLVFLRHLRVIDRDGLDLVQIKTIPGYLLTLRLPPQMKGYALIRFSDRVAVSHPQVNGLLNAAPLLYKQKSERYHLPEQLRSLSPFLLREAHSSGKELFNGKKIRLTNDLTPETFQSDYSIEIQPTDYFSTLLSNDLAASEIRRGNERVFDGRTIVGSDDGTIHPLSNSEASNHIGISILAFTSDGHLLLSSASQRAAQNTGKVTPSATGALNPIDFKGLKKDGLQWALRAAAQRELRKEYGLPENLEIEVRLTGYARFLNRGGKPEFYAVATIPKPLKEFEVADDQKHVVEGVKTVAVRGAEIRSFIDEAQRMVEAGFHDYSPALYLSLFFLIPWVKANEALFRKMLDGVSDEKPGTLTYGK
jgi:hypothetical protein